MDTRGSYGVRIGGVDKFAYNHSDSYLSGLGVSLLRDAFTIVAHEKKYKELAEKLALVDQGAKPTEAHIRAFKAFHQYVGGKDDYYALMRGLQGELKQELEFGIMVDGGGFICDSLMCEYAYVFNFDERTIELYEGFNTNRQAAGRYADSSRNPHREGDPELSKYAGCALRVTIPFDKLPLFHLPDEGEIGELLNELVASKSEDGEAQEPSELAIGFIKSGVVIVPPDHYLWR